MDNRVYFRWMGVASLEITANGKTLAVDPFFSRPPVQNFVFGRVAPNSRLVRKHLPACDYVLVSHSHWDHMMDVPEVARNTGAIAFGSPNTCHLLALLGVPKNQIRLIREGDRLDLDGFVVEVLPAEHGFAPITLGPGPLPPNLRPPLRIRDYKMDHCFCFVVHVAGYRLLALPGDTARADLMFVVPTRRGPARYTAMLNEVQPSVVVPVHWDNLFRPLYAASREYTPPGGMTLAWFENFIRETSPETRFLVPEPFRAYDLAELLPGVPQYSAGEPPTGP
jgi:L-ascorbate metabolism protein UlaG (beta-lactamase superfamily)